LGLFWVFFGSLGLCCQRSKVRIPQGPFFFPTIFLIPSTLPAPPLCAGQNPDLAPPATPVPLFVFWSCKIRTRGTGVDYPPVRANRLPLLRHPQATAWKWSWIGLFPSTRASAYFAGMREVLTQQRGSEQSFPRCYSMGLGGWGRRGGPGWRQRRLVALRLPGQPRVPLSEPTRGVSRVGALGATVLDAQTLPSTKKTVMFHPNFGSVSTQFRSSFGSVSAQFRPNFRPNFRPSFGPASAQFRPSFGPVLAQFRLSFGSVSAEFRPNFSAQLRPRFGPGSAQFRPSFGPIFVQFSAQFRFSLGQLARKDNCRF